MALQLYTLRQADLPLERLLEEVAAAGYQGVETVDLQGGDPRTLRGALDQAGLETSSAHVSLTRLREQFDRVVDEHGQVGTPLIIVPYLQVEQRPTDASGWTVLGQELDDLAARLAENGLRFAYHHHDFELVPVEGRTALDWLLSAGDPGRFRLQLDLGWVFAAGGSPMAAMEAYGPRLASVHAKDVVPDQDPPWVDVGDGVLPWREVALAAARWALPWLVVEHDAPSDPLQTARRSAAALSQVLASLR